MPTSQGEPILRLDAVSKSFPQAGSRDRFYAVKNVTLSVGRGETVALVGESGSGKSTLGRIALGLLKPDAGKVWLDGVCLTDCSPAELRSVRVRMQPIFQDATASLNPRRSVRELLAQGLNRYSGDKEQRSVQLLQEVGLRPGNIYLERLPHELSGGQRQRLAIARAIAGEPLLIIADEALSGTDVSIRGQILNVLMDIRERQGVSYLMITHDISIARSFADRVAVMRFGEIVEEGPAEQVLTEPQHEYTKRLVAAVRLVESEESGSPFTDLV